MAGISAQLQPWGTEGYVRAGEQDEPMLCVNNAVTLLRELISWTRQVVSVEESFL